MAPCRLPPLFVDDLGGRATRGHTACPRHAVRPLMSDPLPGARPGVGAPSVISDNHDSRDPSWPRPLAPRGSGRALGDAVRGGEAWLG